jgi:methionyl-tRNA formyltransferase
VNAPEVLERIAKLAPELFAVVAFGQILSPALLALPKLGAINLHGSRLPDYRGASPVQRALWDGRASTGATTIWMDDGIDTGDVILERWAPIEPSDTAASLAARLAMLGAPLLAQSLLLAHAGTAPRVKQAAGGSYAARLRKQDGIIEWSLDAETVWNRQRAVTPWPGATTTFRGARVLVTHAAPLHLLDAGLPAGTIVAAGSAGVDVACSPGVLRVLTLKPEGRSEMTASDWARGVRPEAHARFEPMEMAT